MEFYSTCSKCGATLDPGERCDCEEAEEREQAKIELYLVMEQETNQYAFNWPTGEREKV